MRSLSPRLKLHGNFAILNYSFLLGPSSLLSCVTNPQFDIYNECRLCKKLRQQAEDTLLELGIQAGTVSHHRKNWGIVYSDGLERAILLDCGRVCVGKKECKASTPYRESLLRYQWAPRRRDDQIHNAFKALVFALPELLIILS